MSRRRARPDLDLLGTCDGAKDDLCELPRLERAVGDPADNLQPALDDRHRVVVPVKHESGDVLARHLGQLLLENVLEAGEDDERGGVAVVGDDAELDNPVTLLRDGGALASDLRREERVSAELEVGWPLFRLY